MTISFDSITNFKDDDEPGQFMVQLQMNVNHVYFVDIDTYTCDCEFYPLISFCKHLAAVQLYFFENVEIKSMNLLFTNSSTSTTTSGHIPMLVLTVITTTIPLNPDTALLTTIPEKLQQLAVYTQLNPPQHLTDTL